VALTPFTRELGTAQGRIEPIRAPADQGEWSFGLGSDTVGRVSRFANGDSIKVAQTDDAPGVVVLRPRVHLRPALAAAPAGVGWTLTAEIEGAPFLSVPLDRVRDLQDVVATLPYLGGAPFELAFKLEVTGAGGPWELELPCAYVDAIREDAAAAVEDVFLCNRLPEPGETRVPRATPFQLDVSGAASGSSPVVASTRIYVNGTLVFDGSAFVGGWSGTFATREVYTRRFSFTPPGPFPSESEVTVRVVTETGAGTPLDRAYSFKVEDYATPSVIGAQARDRRTARVEFSEPMAASASDASNWAIEVVEGPPLVGWGDFRRGAAVWVTPTTVTQVSDRLFDVATDIDMTMGALYRAVVAGVTDVSGNVVDPGAASADFVALDTRPAERRFELVQHVPAMNITEDHTQDLRKFLWAWQEPLDLLLCKIDEWLELLDPDTAPEPFLDAMLEDLGNPFTFALTADEKRRLVGLLVPIYQQKGTAEGIVATIRLFLGLDVTIAYPSFEGAGLGEAELGGATPGTFILGGSAYDHYAYEVVSPSLLDSTQRERIAALAEYMQAANEHLTAIIEPTDPSPVPDHLELGVSELGINWILH
jgi:phage tail-like protein